MIDLLNDHLKQYPLMQGTDVIKLCFQHEFGCEHMVNHEDSLKKLKEECQFLPKQKLRVEPIGHNLARVYLGQLSDIDAYILNQLFIYTARTVKGEKRHFVKKLKACNKELKDPIIDEYLTGDIHSVSHSNIYRETYLPHYRVIRYDILEYFDILKSLYQYLESHDSLTIAIDGKCGSGKSTLASLLKEVFQANLFHMDDFFLQPHQRTPERYQQPGENVDHERFLESVLIPLKHKDTVSYQIFDCQTMTLSSSIEERTYRPINIIEGTYSLHPHLMPFYDIKIGLMIDDDFQIERIVLRNGATQAQMFIDKWIPLENKYFNHYHIFDYVDIFHETKKSYREISL